jgi:hypothetical protein
VEIQRLVLRDPVRQVAIRVARLVLDDRDARERAVYLVRRGVEDDGRPRRTARRLEHVQRAERIAREVGARIRDRARDRGLAREVDDDVDTAHRLLERVVVLHPASDEGERPITVRGAEPFEVRGHARPREVVEDDHRVAPVEEPMHVVRADEAGAACHEMAHRPPVENGGRGG